MCLVANWYLFQYSNGYIQVIGFQTVSCMQFFLLSVAADEIFIISNSSVGYPYRLSQVRRLNAAVAICRRYRLSEDIALILMYTYFKKGWPGAIVNTMTERKLLAFKKFQYNQATTLWNLNSRRIR